MTGKVPVVVAAALMGRCGALRHGSWHELLAERGGWAERGGLHTNVYTSWDLITVCYINLLKYFLDFFLPLPYIPKL
jgi:hypothetical protein